MINISFNNRYECCGCSACNSACPKECIVMQPDAEGFVYPVVDTSLCIDCGLCNKVCPLENYKEVKIDSKVYAAQSKKQDILSVSASGGIFSHLALDVIANGGVVFGARYADDFKSVMHYKAANTTDIRHAFSSKYAQSNMLKCYKEVKDELKRGTHVLFSGTPCQIDGLKCYLRKDYENLFTADLICHGVPSGLVLRKYVEFLEKRYKSTVSAINMRDKKSGWRKVRVKFTFASGKEIIDTEDSNLWFRYFSQHFLLRPSCHKCPYTTVNRKGDITIADYWGIEQQHPENKFDVDRGVSLVLVNGERGEKMFDNISKEIDYIESSMDKCIIKQPQLQHTADASVRRESFSKAVSKHSFQYLAIRYLDYGFWGKVYYKLRNYTKRITQR